MTIQQIVAAIFKGQVETKMVVKGGQQNLSATNTSFNSGVTGSETKMQILQLAKFYETLAKLKIKKVVAEASNLSRFLSSGSAFIVLKKLVKVIEEFLRNHYLKAFGYQKKRLVEGPAGRFKEHGTESAPDEEEYYDEEEEPVAEKKASPAPAVIFQAPTQKL